jgi:2-keto-3-deoxy-L-rhamnonate aldolase RhmA
VAPSFKKDLKEGKLLIGMLQTLPSPEIAEILVSAGFDWIFVDMEHSALDVQSAQLILQAANPCPCIVRSPSHDVTWIKKILDIGASGIIFPMVNTPNQASSIIRHCKYPPEGTRSVGISRAHGYGSKFKEYVENANDEVSVILQIEHIEGVKNFESIAKIPCIDAIFIGPYDLSGSMGKLGQVHDADVQEQIERVRLICKDAGLPVGIFCSKPEEVKPFIQKGFNLIAVGIDTMYFSQSVSNALDVIKR